VLSSTPSVFICGRVDMDKLKGKQNEAGYPDVQLKY
jgi:hypothetical protein